MTHNILILVYYFLKLAERAFLRVFNGASYQSGVLRSLQEIVAFENFKSL